MSPMASTRICRRRNYQQLVQHMKRVRCAGDALLDRGTPGGNDDQNSNQTKWKQWKQWRWNGGWDERKETTNKTDHVENSPAEHVQATRKQFQTLLSTINYVIKLLKEATVLWGLRVPSKHGTHWSSLMVWFCISSIPSIQPDGIGNKTGFPVIIRYFCIQKGHPGYQTVQYRFHDSIQ